ncbi:MAG TPA: transcription-repair coupling factor [Syntrophobacteraceae bacterium]|nr:transcription-repair coupling factor [Syntrophobacteraceae bacterium]
MGSTEFHRELIELSEERIPVGADLKCTSADVVSFLKKSKETAVFRGVQPSALAYLVSMAMRRVRRPFVLIAPTDREAERFTEMICFFAGASHPDSGTVGQAARFSRTGRDHVRDDDNVLGRLVWFLPSRTGHKVQALGKAETTARRVEALYALRAASSPMVVVTSALAVIERLVPPEILVANMEYRLPGESLDPESFMRRLIERGFFRVSLVEDYGDLSRRGGVLDVYAPLYRWPLRFEFFGDQLESVRLFHPLTQRSMGVLHEAVILPANEIILDAEARRRAQEAVYRDVRDELLTPAAGNIWLDRIAEGYHLGAFESVFSIFFEKTASLWEYLDRNSILVWTDAVEVRRQMEEHRAKILRAWEEEGVQSEWKKHPEELYDPPERSFEAATRFQQLLSNSLSEQKDAATVFDLGTSSHSELAASVKAHQNRERLLEPLAARFRRWIGQGVSVFLVCSHKERAVRIAELLQDYGIESVVSGSGFGEESFESSLVKIIQGTLGNGFFWQSERLAVVAEEEIFERRSRRRGQKPVAGIFLSSFQDLHQGDLVVHVDHGIGVYKELAHLNAGGIENDFLLIAYQDGDKLYVPVDKLEKVQKYMGLEGQDPQVDKLGGRSWEKAKNKARESAQKLAEELLELYAVRQMGEGYSFTPPDHYFQEFETTFAFEETPDQLKAIEDVLDDMTSKRPMDRLICGDVGYGKTEVALRAAFKAVMDGKQVAMLVPTTVLAEQHHESFLERFEKFPVNVASLSRFKTASQQKAILDGLRKGSVDIVIGTHRLLQEDVAFRDLGLLIIDEEHRFGVRHKEKLKKLRASVDVLTLTATPIPRTLHMALAGIRDLSTIETPPQDRRAIETYVTNYDEFSIREAIYGEINRGGQVFFVHNHVQTIQQMAARLEVLVPEARIRVAHGQMKERDLEGVMLDFIHRKIDVLVCTTIIESGLDIPAANTIIINRADKFGLAQIYQMRGRVGRSSEQAYAYLIIPGETLITRDAQKRLRALLDFSELGAGFKIALNDLQIRGGGAILGSSQSGHIAAIGYELYLELLEKAIKSMKSDGAQIETVETEINLPISAFLPEDFICDTDQRLIAYKRLATLADEQSIEDLAGEWRDRYGPLPETAKNLVLMAMMRLLLKRRSVVRLDGDADNFTLYFAQGVDIWPMMSFFEQKKLNFAPESERKLKVEIWGRNFPQRILRLKRILQEIDENATGGELN